MYLPSVPRHESHPNLAFAALPLADFFGISLNDNTVVPCTGVGTVINAEFVTLPAGAELVAYWVSVASAAGIWAQAGYLVSSLMPGYIESFTQFWDLNTGTLLETDIGSSPMTLGPHDFRIYYTGSGTMWRVDIDGVLFATYDLKATISEGVGQYPVQALMEEQQGSFNEPIAVTFNQALLVQKNGQWIPCPKATLYQLVQDSGSGIPGVAGRVQNSSLANNEMILGGSTPIVPAGTVLWDSSIIPPPSSNLKMILGASAIAGGLLFLYKGLE